jgi:hypothetical protein
MIPLGKMAGNSLLDKKKALFSDFVAIDCKYD